MPGTQAKMNGRKRRAPAPVSAPTNNNTINHKLVPIDDDASSSKSALKMFPLPIPKRSNIKGKPLVCGSGEVGQLGLGNDVNKFERKRPALLSSIKENVVEVCAGGMHSLVLTDNGLVYSFGCNDEGALGRDTSIEGSEYEPDLVSLPEKVVMCSAGDSHSACLLENGAIMAWGSFRDSHGNMGLTLEGNKRVPVDILPGIKCCSIASGSDHLVILTCAGYVYTVGCAEQGQLGRISTRSVSGKGRRGKSDLLRPCRVFIKRANLLDGIWATNYCTFVRESRTGRIIGFGLNNYKQLAHDKDVSVAINPIVTDFVDVKTIAGGQHHTMVLKHDGTVYVVGRHDYGRLGLADIKEDVTSLKQIEAFKNKFIVDISCGETTSFAITKEGDLYSWGMGTNYQLGTGSDDDALIPIHIQSKETTNKRIIRAASGGQHSIFLVKNSSKDDLPVPDSTN